MMSVFVYSKYFNELKDEAAKKQYEEKIKIIHHSKDPFCELESRQASFLGLDWNEWPYVLYVDIYNYLILTPSEYIHDQLKAYKSLEGYNYFVNGWVSNLNVTKTSSHPADYLFLANVKHSQSLSSLHQRSGLFLKLVVKYCVPTVLVWQAWVKPPHILQQYCLVLRLTLVLKVSFPQHHYHARGCHHPSEVLSTLQYPR